MLIAKVKDNIEKRDLKVRKFNSIFKRKIYSLEPLKTKKNFSKIEVDNFIIKIADKKSELKKAQALRYAVFYKEKKAIPTISKKILSLDYDKVDKFADHLIVIDKNRKGIKNKIVYSQKNAFYPMIQLVGLNSIARGIDQEIIIGSDVGLNYYSQIWRFYPSYQMRLHHQNLQH